MSAQIPPVEDNPVVGFVDWHNVADNVRELDLEWLQNRTVVRFDNLAAANSYSGNPDKVAGSLEEGQVAYFLGTKQLAVKVGASTYKYALLSGLLTATDAGTSVSLSNAGTGGITLPADGTVGVSSLKVATDKLVLDSSGLRLKIGTATANLTTSATDLVSDIPVQAPTLKAAGAVQAASAAISGAVAAASLAVTTAAVSGAASVGSLASAGAITGLSLNIGTGALVASGAGVTAAGALTTGGAITASSGNITATTGDVVATHGVWTDNLYLNSAAQLQWESATNGIIRNVGDGTWTRVSGAKHRLGSSALSGTTPSEPELRRNEPQWRIGRASGTLGDHSGSEGWLRVDFPESFPRGALAVVISNHYAGGGAGSVQAHMTPVVPSNQVDNAGFYVEFYQAAFGATKVANGTAVEIGYIAFGW